MSAYIFKKESLKEFRRNLLQRLIPKIEFCNKPSYYNCIWIIYLWLGNYLFSLAKQ